MCNQVNRQLGMQRLHQASLERGNVSGSWLFGTQKNPSNYEAYDIISASFVSEVKT